MEKNQFHLLLLTQCDCLTPHALRFTKDVDDAKDLIQDTLLKAFSNLDKYEEGTNIKGWLYTIMRNLFVNNYRKKSAMFFPIEPEALALSGQEYHTHNQAESNLALEHINSILSSLPTQYSTPFLLYLKGYKYDEITQLLLVPLGTIKNRIHVARKILKEKYKV